MVLSPHMLYWFFNCLSLFILSLNVNDIFYLDFVACSGWKDMVDEWVSATAPAVAVIGAVSGMNLFPNILL